MQDILASKTVGMTELREPKKVIEEAGDQPVAVMNRNQVVGYFVPVSCVERVKIEYVSDTDLDVILTDQDALTADGVAYLRDK